MANIAQNVYVIGPHMTTPQGIVKQTTWWPLWLFSKFMRGWTIGVHVRGGAYDGETSPAWLQGVLENGASWLDASACVDDDGTVSLVVVNINEERDYDVDLSGVGTDVSVYTISGVSVKAVNTAEEEVVGVKDSKGDGQGKFRFGKHSLTMLRWETGRKVVEIMKRDGEKLDNRKLAWS